MEERVVNINGEMIPESEAKISIFDRGFQGGDAVYESTRTFDKTKPFKLEQHIDRLFSSCRYLRVDPAISEKALERISLEVLDANVHLLGENEEYWIQHIVTRGPGWWDVQEAGPPTVVVFNRPVKFDGYAKLYEEGAHVVTPSIRHVPPQCYDPKMKNYSHVHFSLADFEAKLADPECYTLLLDIEGNIAEVTGGNFLLVKNGTIVSPGPRNILLGISRQTIFELADQLGIPWVEKDIQAYDVYNADEAFLTSTSYCALPVSRLNGQRIGGGIPGPINKRLLEAWSELVGLDIVAQAMSHVA